jgi:tetratricopeptide (TPR) repeat protein
VLDGIALAQRAKGALADAEVALRRALAIRERRDGNATDVSATLVALGSVCRDQREVAEGEMHLRRAVDMRRRRSGGDDLAVAVALQELATLYRMEWRLTDAEEVYLRVLAIKEAALGAHHPDVGETLQHLERTYLAQGRHGEADRAHRRAADISASGNTKSQPAVN